MHNYGEEFFSIPGSSNRRQLIGLPRDSMRMRSASNHGKNRSQDQKDISLRRSDVQELYTRNIDCYAAFIRALQSARGMQTLLLRSNLLHAGLRVLDTGCGFGMVTFALLNVLRQNNFDYRGIDAFDITPAMLVRFQQTLKDGAIARVQVRQAVCSLSTRCRLLGQITI